MLVLFIVIMIAVFRQSLYEGVIFIQDTWQQRVEERNYKNLEDIYEEIKEPLEKIVEETRYDIKGKEGFSIDFPEEKPRKGSKYSPEEIVFYNGEIRDVNSAIYKGYFLSKPELVSAVKVLEGKKIIVHIHFNMYGNEAYETGFCIKPEKTKFINNNGATNEIFYSDNSNEEFDFEGYGYHAIGDNWYVRIGPTRNE